MASLVLVGVLGAVSCVDGSAVDGKVGVLFAGWEHQVAELAVLHWLCLWVLVLTFVNGLWVPSILKVCMALSKFSGVIYPFHSVSK